MNLKIILLSTLFISANTLTINAMNTQQKQEQPIDLQARLLKLNLDINNLSYHNGQTISQNPDWTFNITNHNTLTSIAKSSIDIATFVKETAEINSMLL